MTKIRLINDWVRGQKSSASSDLAGAIATLLQRYQRGHLNARVARQSKFTPPLAQEDASVTQGKGFAPARAETIVLFAAPAALCRLPEARPSWIEECALIPVVEKAADAAQLRDYLQPLNAFVLEQYGKDRWQRLADAVVSTAAFRHTKRRVFISYRRSDGTKVARQLAARLAEEGFETFLDEQAIPVGRSFNAEIGYRLNDADLVLIVVSADANKSQWMHKEISFANRASIGLLAIDIRPDRSQPNTVRDAVFRDQSCSPTLINGEIEATSLQGIMSLAFQLRVAALLRRLQSHVPAARAHLANAHPGHLIEDGPAFGEFSARGTSARTFAFPHRPALEQIFEAHRTNTNADLGIFHPENAINDPRVVSLRWALRPWNPTVGVHHVYRLWRK